MSAKRRLLPWVLVCLLLYPLASQAGDLEPCQKALQTLKSASRRAALEVLETRRNGKQLKECIRLGSRCTASENVCKKAKEENQRQQEEMKAALQRVRAAMREVTKACCQPAPTSANRKDNSASKGN